MREDNRPPEMSADQRRQEVAAILAKGVLRHCRLAKLAACPSQGESHENRQNPLEVSAASRLPVPTGSGGYHRREPEKGHRR